MGEPVVDMALGWAKDKARAKRFEALLRETWETIDAGVYGPGDVCDLSIKIKKALDEEGKDGDGGG